MLEATRKLWDIAERLNDERLSLEQTQALVASAIIIIADVLREMNRGSK